MVVYYGFILLIAFKRDLFATKVAGNVTFGIVLGVVWNMTEKPGWGGSIAAMLVGYAVGAALALYFSRAPQEELATASDSAA